jgi:transcriptional regulator with XRE-family HTH domain
MEAITSRPVDHSREVYDSLIPARLKPQPHRLRAVFSGKIPWADLAGFTGYSQPTVSRWMNGQQSMPPFIEEALDDLAERMRRAEIEAGLIDAER